MGGGRGQKVGNLFKATTRLVDRRSHSRYKDLHFRGLRNDCRSRIDDSALESFCARVHEGLSYPQPDEIQLVIKICRLRARARAFYTREPA